MAKGKGGKRSVSTGPKKMHGPKKKMFHCWSSTIRLQLAKAGLLKKENNYESWQQAAQAKGKRNATIHEFNEYVKLDKDKQKVYFENLK